MLLTGIKHTSSLRSYMKIKASHIIFLVTSLISFRMHGQYESNPLADKAWVNFSNGFNTGDNFSWQSAISYSKRSDVLIMGYRLSYSQELFEADNDSVFSPKNRLLEAGIMWGEGYGGKNWYVSLSGGMGLNVRIVGDDIEDTNETETITAVTIGVPVQLEAGALMGQNWGINITGVANWNFREPYVGAHLGFFYRPSKKKK